MPVIQCIEKQIITRNEAIAPLAPRQRGACTRTALLVGSEWWRGPSSTVPLLHDTVHFAGNRGQAS